MVVVVAVMRRRVCVRVCLGEHTVSSSLQCALLWGAVALLVGIGRPFFWDVTYYQSIGSFPPFQLYILAYILTHLRDGRLR